MNERVLASLSLWETCLMGDEYRSTAKALLLSLAERRKRERAEGEGADDLVGEER